MIGRMNGVPGPARVRFARREGAGQLKSVRARSASASQARRASRASRASFALRSSPRAVALASRDSRSAIERLQLLHGRLGAGPGLGVAAGPDLVLGILHRLLDGAQPVVDRAHRVARHLADRVPAVQQVAQLLAAGLRVGDREHRLGLEQQHLLLLQVGALLDVLLGLDRVPGAEELCPGRRGTGPTACRRPHAAPARRPSTAASGRGTGPRSGPSRWTRRAPRPRRPAVP